MQEKQLSLVNFEQAKKLKELGFDWLCYIYSDSEGNDTLVVDTLKNHKKRFDKLCNYSQLPLTVALALKWFRDVKGVFTGIYNNNMVYCDLEFDYVGVILFDEKRIFTKHYDTYDEAESALLDALLEYYKKEVQDA